MCELLEPGFRWWLRRLGNDLGLENQTAVVMVFTVDQSILDSIHQILEIARFTLQERGEHLPTAVLHTWDGMLPIVLPFEDDAQKKSLMEYVKQQAVEKDAYAVTTVTLARIVDSRTSEEEECLVVATAIQPGRPYVLVQRFSRDAGGRVIDFGPLAEGDDAAMPGQMIIFPLWGDETYH
jgi:hypothetical protein